MKWPLLVVAIACTILVTCDNSNTSRSSEWYSSFVTNAYEESNSSIARDSVYRNKHEEKTTSAVNINEANYITEVNNSSDGNIYEEGNTNIYEMSNIYNVSNFTDTLNSFINSNTGYSLNASNSYVYNNRSKTSDVYEMLREFRYFSQFKNLRPDTKINCRPGFKLIDGRCRNCYGECD